MDSNATDPKQALVDKLKSSTNILVTVSANPTVDQLAACLGLTLWLNKIEKHATAVFSGEVPSTLEFLQPEATLEKNTDSLRDFIIALDKSKADKLRYKVEDSVVKIFITPYRTSLSADDLEFSQGDFNVDLVIALGVHAQQDLDTAITAHGRILHDAAVATITTGEQASELGSISWHDGQASSLSELVVDLGNVVDQAQLDGQIATALLTGIVAETERFSNEKTTPQTMSVSAQLMSAGANQQLVASKLEEPAPEPVPEPVKEPTAETTDEKPQDGTLEIEHPADEKPADTPTPEEPEEPVEEFTLPPVAEPDTENEGNLESPVVTDVKTTNSELSAADQPAVVEENEPATESRLITEPPTMGGTLTANSKPEDVMLEPSSDPLSQPSANAEEQPLLDRASEPASSEPTNTEPESIEPPVAVDPAPAEPVAPQPAPPSWMPPQPWMNKDADTSAPNGQTLEDIEREVKSTHVQGDVPANDTAPSPDLNAARDEVMKAIDSTPNPNPEPIQALNAQPFDLAPPEPNATVQPAEAPAAQSTAFDPAAFGISNDPDPELTGPIDQPFTLPVPGGALTPPPANPVPPTSTSDQPAPPPVPPPMTRF